MRGGETRKSHCEKSKPGALSVEISVGVDEASLLHLNGISYEKILQPRRSSIGHGRDPGDLGLDQFVFGFARRAVLIWRFACKNIFDRIINPKGSDQ